MTDFPQTQHRVKVYLLTDGGEWYDCGTGILTFNTVGYIEICHENENGNTSDLLLKHEIIDNVRYARQGSNIIQFIDQIDGKERAISFQSSDQCSDIWQLIQKRMREINKELNDEKNCSNLESEVIENGKIEEGNDVLWRLFNNNGGDIAVVAEVMTEEVSETISEEDSTAEMIPFANADNIDIIHEMVVYNSLSFFSSSSAIIVRLASDHWKNSLYSTFLTIENNAISNNKMFDGSRHALQNISGIVSFCLIHPLLRNSWLSMSFVDKTIAMMEYDVDKHKNSSNNNNQGLCHSHRHFLQESVHQSLFSQFQIKIKNELEMNDKIRYLYHLMYVQDCILVRKVDIRELINDMNADICRWMVGNEDGLRQFFALIKKTKDSKKHKLFSFLVEFLLRIRAVADISIRHSLYEQLLNLGVLNTFKHCLQMKSMNDMQSVIIVCMHQMVTLQCPTINFFSISPVLSAFGSSEQVNSGPYCGGQWLFREFICKQMTEHEHNLIYILCQLFCNTSNEDILQQIQDIFRELMSLNDNTIFNMGRNSPPPMNGMLSTVSNDDKQLSIIVTFFINECIPQLLHMLTTDTQMKCKLVIELLTMLVQNESQLYISHMQMIETQSNLLQSIVNLMQFNADTKIIQNKSLCLCCLRFVRGCLTIDDSTCFWSVRICELNVFSHIFRMFEINGVKSNMLNSSVLSILCVIRDRNLYHIISHFAHNSYLQKIKKYVQINKLVIDLQHMHSSTQSKEIESVKIQDMQELNMDSEDDIDLNHQTQNDVLLLPNRHQNNTSDFNLLALAKENENTDSIAFRFKSNSSFSRKRPISEIETNSNTNCNSNETNPKVIKFMTVNNKRLKNVV